MVSYDQVDSTCVCHAAFPPAEPYQDGVEQVSPTVQQDCTQTTKTRTSGTHTLKYIANVQPFSKSSQALTSPQSKI